MLYSICLIVVTSIFCLMERARSAKSSRGDSGSGRREVGRDGGRDEVDDGREVGPGHVRVSSSSVTSTSST